MAISRALDTVMFDNADIDTDVDITPGGWVLRGEWCGCLHHKEDHGSKPC